MLRLLIAIVLVYILYVVVRRILHPRAHHKAASRQHPPAIAPAEMVACSQCGTFVIRAEATFREGHYFCSDACAHGKTS